MSADAAELHAQVEHAGAVAPSAGTLLGRPLAFWRETTAHELGLPAGLTVAAGHQAEWWHPGILAKFVWAQELAACSGAATAWLMVDTDVRDPFAMRIPMAEGGALRTTEHRFGPRAPAGTPPCTRPSTVPDACSPARGTFALPCVAQGAGRAFDALLAAVDATDAAAQAWDGSCSREDAAVTALVEGSQACLELAAASSPGIRALLEAALSQSVPAAPASSSQQECG